jgi:NTE family protein
VKGTLGLARAMVGTMTNFHDQMHIDDPTVLARTMFVDTGGVKATDFDIDEVSQDMLFANGLKGCERFLSGWDFDAYVTRFRGDAGEPTDADGAHDTVDPTAEQPSLPGDGVVTPP